MRNLKILTIFSIVLMLLIGTAHAAGTGLGTNAIGVDNSDNAFSSSNVSANRDGSLLERTEFIMDSVADVAAGGITDVEKSAYNETVVLTGGSVPSIFTITGGPILLLSVIAECYSTVSANACGLTLTVNPTYGTDVALQTSAIDINAMAQGSIISWSATGNAVDGAIRVTGTSLAYGSEQGIVIPEGNIDLTLANSDPTTGAVNFYIRYKPLRSNAAVTGD